MVPVDVSMSVSIDRATRRPADNSEYRKLNLEAEELGWAVWRSARRMDGE